MINSVLTRFIYCSKEEKKRLYQTIILPEVRHILKLRLIKTVQFLLLKLAQRKNLAQKKGKLLQYRAALDGYRDFRKASFGSGPSWLFNNNLKHSGKIPYLINL